MRLNNPLIKINYEKLNKFPPWEPEEVKIAKKILTALMIGLLVPAFFLSSHGLYYLMRGVIRYAFTKRDFDREIKRLQRKGFVALTKTPEGWLIRLLKKGLRAQEKIQIEELTLPVRKPWDKKWRLYIFDIPEECRRARDLLRMKLKELGMYNIQRSVFVYPYDCRKELEFIASFFRVDKYASYAEVGFIDIDKELRRHFKSHLVI